MGRPVSQLFMDCAPLAWRFDIASVSADDFGPLEVRVYCARLQTLVSPKQGKAPFLSFFLPFTGQEDWSEESVLSFTWHLHTPCTQIQDRLTSWAPPLAADFTTSHIAHCFGKVKWENGLCQFILPVLFDFAESWPLPLETVQWSVKRIAKTLSCPQAYVTRWFAAAHDFGPGAEILMLPPDTGKFDPPISRPEAKRQRSVRS